MDLPELRNPFTNGCIVGANVDPEAYHKQDLPRGHPDYVMSRGELMNFNACPHKWLLGVEDEKTKSTEWGNLMDTLVLSPELFLERYAVSPETYMAEGKRKGDPDIEKPWNRNANACYEWEYEQTNAGKKVVKHNVHAEAMLAVQAIQTDPEIVRILANSQKQVLVTAEYRDKATGLVVPFKVLIDIVPDFAMDWPYRKHLMDLKTAVSVDPKDWCWTVANYDLHVQGACYLDAYTSAKPDEDRVEFSHIAQENFAPFEPFRHTIASDSLMLGRADYTAALRKYCQCLATKTWPSYAPLAGQMVINGWHYAQPVPKMVR